jgi:DNA helicase-2/ATP-dependent DNA helicase PcrA
MGLRNYADCAILYRTNAQSRGLEEQFMRFGVPYKIVGGVRFYDRAEIKDIIAYLRLMYQSEDETSFRRIINVPTRGLGAKSVDHFFEFKSSHNYSIDQALLSVDQADLTPKAKNSFKEFADIIHSFRAESESITVAILLEKLIKRLGFENYLDDGTPQGEARKRKC